MTASGAAGPPGGGPPVKKRKQRRKDGAGKDKDKLMASLHEPPAIDAAQQAVYDQMRRALNEHKYSAVGSIIEHTDSEEEEDDADLFLYRGQPVRLDRNAMQQTSKKMTQAYWHPALAAMKKKALGGKADQPLIYTDFLSQTEASDDEGSLADKEDLSDDEDRTFSKSKRKKDAFVADAAETAKLPSATTTSAPATSDSLLGADAEEDLDRDGGSIFGQTTGATNSTWVECDKCKKWRRLRGVVDEKKLPTKWYCSMNRNDPERARCSAPEEDYETQQTPESAADARTRKHLRVWVRRLQCQEAFEARQPTLTRGKKRAATSSMKDPYEWVRCCNPSCGKWRAVLRFMDAKSTVCERTVDGEWYCVMNTWDEKMASCAAPQENLPAVGCPSWVMQDGDA